MAASLQWPHSYQTANFFTFNIYGLNIQMGNILFLLRHKMTLYKRIIFIASIQIDLGLWKRF